MDCKALRMEQSERLLRGVCALGGVCHAAERPAQIDRGRAGGVQIVRLLLQFGEKFRKGNGGNLLCEDIEGVSGTDADRRRAAHLERADRIEQLLRRAQGQIDRAVGKLGLVDDDDGGAVPAQTDVVDMGDLMEFLHDSPSILVFCLYYTIFESKRKTSPNGKVFRNV